MKYLILFSTLLFSSFCFSQPYVKNGYPCISELCIGDTISELKKINFKKPRSKDISPKEIAEIAVKYRGKINKESAFYLKWGIFDVEALDPLSGVLASCEGGVVLVGKYTTQNGNDTEVSLALLPANENSDEQKWTVVRIVRSIYTPMTKQEYKEAKAQLDERYKAFNTEDEEGRLKSKPTDKGAYTFLSSSEDYLSFLLEYSSPSHNRFSEEIKEIKIPSICKNRKVNLE